ncbi:MAG: M18 family aminopeptidase [Treponema sp.]|nr:M18 family aminopeptidase [Treponema sp.]
MKDTTAQELLDFIQDSPSCFHVIAQFAKKLIQNGFIELDEKNTWNIQKGGKYFVTKNSSSIIAFIVPKTDYKGFSIVASHSDSPSFKIKENSEIHSDNVFIKLNIEKYGGMLCAPWFDRPLSIAGRIIYKDSNNTDNPLNLKQKLVNIDRDLIMIPNLAIHFNRDANNGHTYNVQNEMLPILSCNQEKATQKSELMELVASSANIEQNLILATDLYLYNRQPGTFWGAKNEFIASTKLDDLECAFTTFKAFTASENDTHILVHCVFDNEEVGSQTQQGAASTFLHDTLVRINECFNRSQQAFLQSLANSFMISADNAHALHPNFSASSDPINRPIPNGGPVIKFNASQKYTSDAISASVFKSVCERASVPYQIFTNRSDIAGGSTLGNISGTQVSIPAVDIGLAQWAMHSPYESAGAKDPALMIRAITEFYRTTWTLAIE